MGLKPGYKQAEVGVIPEGWSTPPLGQLIHSVEYGSSAKSRPSGKVPVLRMGNLQDGGIDWRDLVFTNSEAEIKKYFLRPGDVLFNRTNTIELVGKTSIYKGECSAIFAGYLIRINENKSLLDSRFLNYVLNAEFSKKYSLKILSVAIGQANINGNKLKTYPVPLPPTLAEQRAIAEALSDMDALIESLEQLLTKKRQVKKAAMQELLTGKRRLSGFSGGWIKKSLGECLLASPDYGVNASAVPYLDRLPAYIRITDITEDGRFAPAPLVSVAHSSAEKYYLSEGDLVFARTGASVGKSYLYKAFNGALVFAGFLIRVRPDRAVLDPAFLFYLVQTKAYWDWVKLMSMRSGQPGINGKEFSQFPLSIPSVMEQIAISSILSEMEGESIAIETKLQKARHLKQGMMQELLTGRIRLV